ncbi:hypothetical protein [Hyphomicrobium sp.]|uniref:hypothetical protein n=1 Tax=Hyphomicrobium sp. TaxID=82 RepID=UPI001D59F0B7|nr:hypothetical protein [Hyphomicrobium sp.]MBY0561450.1 hypothetical protein [Hyphomicrobium sp.]
MSLPEFHNALRILRCIDHWEFAEKVSTSEALWMAFRRDPYLFFIGTGDDVAERLWKIIEERQIRRNVA